MSPIINLLSSSGTSQAVPAGMLPVPGWVLSLPSPQPASLRKYKCTF